MPLTFFYFDIIIILGNIVYGDDINDSGKA